MSNWINEIQKRHAIDDAIWRDAIADSSQEECDGDEWYETHRDRAELLTLLTAETARADAAETTIRDGISHLCSYCMDNKERSWEEMQQHIHVCEKHPLTAANARADAAEAKLADETARAEGLQRIAVPMNERVMNLLADYPDMTIWEIAEELQTKLNARADALEALLNEYKGAECGALKLYTEANARADALQAQLEQVNLARECLIYDKGKANARADAAEKHNEILAESNQEMMAQLERIRMTLFEPMPQGLNVMQRAARQKVINAIWAAINWQPPEQTP